MQSLLRDMGWDAEVVVWSDSSTAKGIASRRGLGKMRHVELRYFWVQEAVKQGRLKVRKVGGEVNVADHLTKGRAIWEFKGLLEMVGARMEGRGCDGAERRGSRRWSRAAVGGEDGGDGEVGSLTQGSRRSGCRCGRPGGNCGGFRDGGGKAKGIGQEWNGPGESEWRMESGGGWVQCRWDAESHALCQAPGMAFRHELERHDGRGFVPWI